MLEIHVNPQQNEFCVIKGCALVSPLSNLSVYSSGKTDERKSMAGFAVKLNETVDNV